MDNFSAKIFPGGSDRDAIQCFAGDRAIRVDNIGQFWDGFVGLRRTA